MIINQGLLYEERVTNAFQSVTIPKLQLCDQTCSTFSRTDNDVKFLFNDLEYSVEVKKDIYSQMGGTSIQYNKETGLYSTVKNLNDIDRQLILQEFSGMQSKLDEYLDFIKHDAIIKEQKFPLRITINTWEKAKKKGYLKYLNAKIERPLDFLYGIYAEKGVYYMQIGNAGLFYLEKNPLGLPIPQLTGKIDIEMRLGRSGKRLIGIQGSYAEVIGASYRIQGRLKTKQQSPYTLDDPTSISLLFSHIT